VQGRLAREVVAVDGEVAVGRCSIAQNSTFFPDGCFCSWMGIGDLRGRDERQEGERGVQVLPYGLFCFSKFVS
jgi:hypothetical protein